LPAVTVVDVRNVCEGNELLLENLVIAHTGDTLLYTINGVSINTPFITITENITINIVSVNRTSGCVSLPASVLVRALPSPDSDFNLFTNGGLIVTELCAGGSLIVSPRNPDGVWKITPAALARIDGDRLTTYSTLNETTEIIVTYTLTHPITGCVSETDKTVTIHALPKVGDTGLTATLPGNLVIISGRNGSVCEGSEITLSGNYIGLTPWLIVYSDGISTDTLTSVNSSAVLTVDNPTVYSVVSVTDGSGCRNTDANLSALSISIDMKAPVRITTAPQSGAICMPDGTFELSARATGAVGDQLVYTWTNASGEELGTGRTYPATAGGTYWVTVSGGCNLDSASAVISEELPVIVQIRNHTLLVNNNPGTNGGFEFQYYKWYKEGEDKVLWQNSGWENKGGYYYTGGSNLDFDTPYWVVVRDQFGVEHRSCPFMANPAPVQVSVTGYPNPAHSSNPVVTVKAEVSKMSDLEDATITVLSPSGATLDIVRVSGMFTHVVLPGVTGVYILQFRSSVINRDIKIIVE
jgi:hypothetical protein